MENKIDFVITWVDGNEREWQKEKENYLPNKNTDTSSARYREWDNLRYWFRGIEKYASWVNKIYFVTYGHLPKWLNVNNPKLVIVKHSDYMPEKYLPTFSSHPIELNIHRIKGLSEQFVYFNDDMFITNYIKPEDYFKNGKPCEMAVFNPAAADDEVFMQVLNNNNILLNRNFNKKEILKKNKFLSLKYGKYNIRTLLCLPWNRIQGFYNSHSPIAYLKSTFEKVWEKEYEVLNETSKRKFRSADDVNHFIFRDWQFCEGNFCPRKMMSIYCRIQEDIDYACKLIEEQKYKTVCLNDDPIREEFETEKQRLINSFKKILPEKSSFEI